MSQLRTPKGRIPKHHGQYTASRLARDTQEIMHSLVMLLLLPSIALSRILHRPREFRCSSMVVFGDSLSDDGAEAEGESHGFMRNSNGPIWSEYATKMLQCEQYTNFAYSGAKSGPDNFYFEGWSGVGWQVEKYLENTYRMGDDPLVVFQSGGSIDFFTGEKDPSMVIHNIQNSISNLTEAMDGGTLVVLSLLDLSTAPGVRAAEESEELRQRLAELVAETNRQLAHVILDPDLGARKLHPSLKVRFIDINPVVLSAMQRLNTTEPFTHQAAVTKPRSIYQFAYHDLWNPSTVVHHMLAREIVRQLQDLSADQVTAIMAAASEVYAVVKLNEKDHPRLYLLLNREGFHDVSFVHSLDEHPSMAQDERRRNRSRERSSTSSDNGGRSEGADDECDVPEEDVPMFASDSCELEIKEEPEDPVENEKTDMKPEMDIQMLLPFNQYKLRSSTQKSSQICKKGIKKESDIIGVNVREIKPEVIDPQRRSLQRTPARSSVRRASKAYHTPKLLSNSTDAAEEMEHVQAEIPELHLSPSSLHLLNEGDMDTEPWNDENQHLSESENEESNTSDTNSDDSARSFELKEAKIQQIQRQQDSDAEINDDAPTAPASKSNILPQNIPADSKNWECKVCYKIVNRADIISPLTYSQLLWHAKTHCPEKRFSCDVGGCTYWTNRSNHVEDHMTRVHRRRGKAKDNLTAEMNRSWYQRFFECFPNLKKDFRALLFIRKGCGPEKSLNKDGAERCMICANAVKLSNRKIWTAMESGPFYLLMKHAKMHCQLKEYSCAGDNCDYSHALSAKVRMHMRAKHQNTGNPKKDRTDTLEVAWLRSYSECFPTLVVNEYSLTLEK